MNSEHVSNRNVVVVTSKVPMNNKKNVQMRSGCGEYYFKLTAHKEGFWDMAILEIFGFSYFVFHILMQV